KESKKVCDITFNDWVETIKKVWDRHNQEDQNRISNVDLESIIEARIKRKPDISLYDDFAILVSN
ncbi:33993_t:CDS:1, partial [Racocetra persica]